ncbi:MAG TPA: DoxX-like family protein [Polyangiaceae bacterium]|jgi:uncharacterized membrane protein|nr:DoxX-like family protein [Polyangiaceae bacterium]
MTDEPIESRAKRIARHVLAIAMVTVGVLHFANPTPFIRIVPSALPAPDLLVYLSGAIEIALGLALVTRRTREKAAWGLVALFVAVFPANVNMAVNHIALDPANPTPSWAAWARLPLQAVLIVWALWVRK